MYNNHLYNQKLYNANVEGVALATEGDLILNNLSLQSENIITQNVQYDSAPQRDFRTQAVPRNDGEIIIGDYWRRKVIKLSGILKYDTNELLECAIDNFKKTVTARESLLKVAISCTPRQFTVTAINTDKMFNQRKGYHITVCPFELDLLCLTPFSLSPDYVSQTISDKSVVNLSEQFFNDGTAPGSPVVVFVFTEATNVSSVKFTNNTTSESIELNTSVETGDYLRFDGENKEVTLNGDQVDYNGSFPVLQPGSNFYTININGDSVIYTMTIKHKIPYL